MEVMIDAADEKQTREALTSCRSDDNDDTQEENRIDQVNVQSMVDACYQGQLNVVQELISQNPLYARQQLDSTGQSPLMAAAAAGNHALCQFLLEQGAPWNALDRQGQCAGNHATTAERWTVVNLLVDWGVRAELILGQIERGNHHRQHDHQQQHQHSSTKPDYLRQRLHYTADGQALLDQDQDAVMMEWERPLMKAHAQIMMENNSCDGRVVQRKRRVLNVGFGMGIIDSALQDLQPDHHIIIEAHPDVYHQKMIADGWDQKPNVRICLGRWQDVIPQLIAENVKVDAIFFDTYGEHYTDLEDFHQQMVHLLEQPHGVYSFFNGLAPDNLFFHGVACQCVELQLSRLGLDCEFLPCEIQVRDDVWEGIRRRYWHGRDTYYLPRATWNASYLSTGHTTAQQPLLGPESSSPTKSKLTMDSSNDDGDHDMPTEATTSNNMNDGKRQRFG